MGKIIVIISFFGFAGNSISAQESVPLHQKIFIAALKDSSGKWTRGYLVHIDDSSLVISKNERPVNISSPAKPVEGELFQYSNIEKLKLKKKGAGATGAIYGALAAGTLVGIATAISLEGEGYAAIFFFNKITVIALAATFAAIAGALVGAAIAGAIHLNFNIRRAKEKFAQMSRVMIRKIKIKNR